MTERWLSVEEIANHLGVSKDTIYAWRDKKGLPAHRIGRFWKFKTVEVDTWVIDGDAADKPEGEK
jgi:excisionase family DNA binding protein